MKIFLVCEDGNMLYLDSGMGCMDVCNCQNSLNVLLKLYIWGHVNYAPIKKKFFLNKKANMSNLILIEFMVI